MRLKPHLAWLIPLLLLLVALLVIIGSGAREWGVSHSVIPANGSAGTRIRLPLPAGFDPARLGVRVRHDLLKLVSVISSAEALELNFEAGYRGGEELVTVTGLPEGPIEYRIKLLAAPIDLDGDGFPDAAELWTETERERFRAWFCVIAESQFYQIWDSWIPEQRDCSGLVRFALREALVKHDEAWLKKAGRLLLRSSLPDLKAWNYPNVPFLGTRLFRLRAPRPGGEDGSSFDLDDFAPFVTARILFEHNCVFLGRSLERQNLLPGDLLFFAQSDYEVENPDEAMHVMIYLGRRAGEESLVYHTGDPETGEVRKLTVATLLNHPDPRWRPLPENPGFLGIGRLTILEDNRRFSW